MLQSVATKSYSLLVNSMSKHFVFGLCTLASLVVGVSVAKAETGIPEFNALCWQRSACQEIVAQQIAGKSFSQLQAGSKEYALAVGGFVAGEGICKGGSGDSEWGKCLPSGKTKTEISFGGKTEFSNIGEFLQVNYTYAIGIAAILAVLVLIVAGIQWVSSAGNSEAISSAKSRIGGALIGLFIAYSSYFILQTVNPTLVAFRLPQTWMIRPQSMVPQFCMGAPDTTSFHFAGEYTDQISAIPAPDASIKYDLPYSEVKTTKFYCGHRFYMTEGGDATCFGNVCNAGTSCVELGADDPQKKTPEGAKMRYGCKAGQLFLRFAVTSFGDQVAAKLPVNWSNIGSKDWLDDNAFTFYGVCRNSATNKLTIGDNEEWDGGSEGYQVVEQAGSTFNTYETMFGNLTDAYKPTDWCSPAQGELVGFILTGELDINYTIRKDARFVVGYKDHTGPAVVGAWDKQVTIKDYFPLDQLPSGITANADLDGTAVEAVVNDAGTYPQGSYAQ